MTLPFQISREIASNFGSAAREVRDENTIERVLSQAMNNPQVLQNSIGQILSQVSPERQGEAIKYLQGSMQNMQKQQQQQQRRSALEKYGINADFPESLQKIQYENQLKDERFQNADSLFSPQTAIPNQNNQLNNQQNKLQNLPQQQQQQQSLENLDQNILNTQDIQNNQQKSIVNTEQNKNNLFRLLAHPDNAIRERAKGELKQLQEDNILSQKEVKRLRDEEISFHKESEKYDEELFKQNKAAKRQVEAIKDINTALASGNVSRGSLSNIFKGFGKIGDKLSEILLKPDEATIQASIPYLLEGWKEVFGVRLTDADLRLLQDKLPSIGKSVEANMAITKILKKYADLTLLRGTIAKEIKAQNKGLRPLGYADKVEERFDQMIQPVQIIYSNNGIDRKIDIPAYKVSEAIQAGARLANE